MKGIIAIIVTTVPCAMVVKIVSFFLWSKRHPDVSWWPSKISFDTLNVCEDIIEELNDANSSNFTSRVSLSIL